MQGEVRAGGGRVEIGGTRERADEADDAALVAAIARGDKSALGALYDRHCRLLLALGLRVLGDRTAAEDVLHDVFLEAWHQARTFDPGRGSARAWLVTRMRSRALDRRSTVSRQARLADSAGKEQATVLTKSSPTGIDLERVRRGVQGLPAELGAVVELAYFDGLSSSEIAKQLGIPVGTVKSRMARAMASLKSELGPGQRGAP
jgi:RNA polymerase sigma-70 factor (ECF subfamily)